MGNKYILCVCEGNSEIAIMETLLELGVLPFKREDLINEKFIKRTSVNNIQRDYLNRSFEKPVYIIRIVDSESENFVLTKEYQPKIRQVFSFVTAPEIEILIIISKGDYGEYTNSKSERRLKPSSYCKEKYRISNVKTKEFVKQYFNDKDKLIEAIKIYDSYSKHQNSFTLRDLIENKIEL